MKFLVNGFKMVNFVNIAGMSVSCNYLKLLMTDGREELFAYDCEDSLKKLFKAIVNFLKYGNYNVFDCKEYLEKLKETK